jgi:glutamate synthase domain-containing protein 2
LTAQVAYRRRTSKAETGNAVAGCNLRGLLDFKPGKAIPLSEVEPAENIMRRFKTGALV